MSTTAKLFLLVALALCTLMPSTQSLWMDEAQTWRLASMPSLSAVVADLRQTQASEAMMPLGMFSAWISARVFGLGEWQMRAPNIFWAAASVVAFAMIGRRWKAPWSPLLFAIQPFLWFYANEARPYALQIAAGAWLLAGLVAAFDERAISAKTLLIVSVASCALVGTTLFGILTAGPAIAILAWFARRERWALPEKWKLCATVVLIWFATLGVYYLFAILRGAAGARLWAVGIQNILFALYEIGGFGGLGFGRTEIRELAQLGKLATILKCPWWGILASGLLAGSYLVAGRWLLMRLKQPKVRDVAISVALIAALSLGALAVLALVVHFPFWGRHAAPVFPFVCGLLIFSIAHAPRRRGLAAIAIACLCLALAVSTVQLRLAPQHRKDDYRSAAVLARKGLEDNKEVWWSADRETARYYGVAFRDPERPGPGAFYASGSSRGMLNTQPLPDLILMSKPDVFDPSGTLAGYVADNQYRREQRFNAFEALVKPPPR